MPDLPTIGGGPSSVGVDAAASSGITLAADSSANTKATTWTELIASTAHESSWLLIAMRQVVGITGGFLVDLGVGASTAEVVLIANLANHTALASKQECRHWLLPLSIPAGTRVSARCQASTGSATIAIAVHAIAAPIDGPPGLARVETCGAQTGSSSAAQLADPGATPHTDGAWTQLIASTGFNYRWLCLEMENLLDTSYAANLTHLVDIGIGGAGTEVEVISDLLAGGNSFDDTSEMTYSFPCAIPAGSRLVARHRCSTGQTGDRRLNLIAYGVG